MPADPPALYPEIEPYETGMLPVNPLHTLYWEQSGNPQGMPVLTLHGGPGGGSLPIHRRYFDPARCRIVTFDQRGCGKSTPHAELRGNTTQELVADIEKLRQHLGIERWVVVGGSWGSFLALAYAEAHPRAVRGILVRGIFLCRRFEVDWWFEGIRTLFPDRWRDFRDFLPEGERDDLLRAYYRRVTDPDPEVHGPAAVALRTYSGWTQTFRPDEDHVKNVAEPAAALPLARLFTHYCINGAFMRPGQLLTDLGRIRHLPAIILQGRYDVVTPMRTAYDLAQAWPEAEFTVVTEANHASNEPAAAEALVNAVTRLLDRVEAG